MKIHFEQGGHVLLHTDGDVHYRDTHSNFSLDAAELAILTPMPSGMVSMDYYVEDEILVHYDAKGNAFPREGRTPWPEAARLCASYGTLAARKQDRVAVEQAAGAAKVEAEQAEHFDRHQVANEAAKAAINAQVEQDDVEHKKQWEADTAARKKASDDEIGAANAALAVQQAQELQQAQEAQAAQRAAFQERAAAARAAFLDEVAAAVAERLKGAA